jgi:NADPH-dependent 2,4-dienoyl-CoA reductase/sulfur reductase-like enzyme/rhodanese-related sulfurtransferase
MAGGQKKIVIVGGVAGGASAAARARRLDEHADILLLQSGPDVSFASCGMPYYIGGVSCYCLTLCCWEEDHTAFLEGGESHNLLVFALQEIQDRAKLAVQTPASLHARLNIDVRVNTRVVSIDLAGQSVVAKNESSGEEFSAQYDELVLAVGAAPFKPPIPGIDRPGNFALRNLDDMDAISGWIGAKTAGKDPSSVHAVVAGAGFVGLEMVEQLMRRGLKVSVVEMMPQVLGPVDQEMAIILQKELERRGVSVYVGDAISEFRPASNGAEGSDVVLKSGIVLPTAQMVILGLGVRPDTEVAKQCGLKVNPRGTIYVDESLKTSDPHVWAVGDAIEVHNPTIPGSEKWAVPLAGPANRQGRMVADNIYGKNRKYKGTWGASVVRMFELMAACVGANEKTLKAKGLPFAAVHVHPGSHAGYFPGAKSINFKLLFNPQDGRIYGAQAVGEDGVEKRIDVIATAMQGGLTVDDLADLELCYAPPVGSAKDPVNMAGMAAQNIMDGMVTQLDWSELDEAAMQSGTTVLDVRNKGEIQGTQPIHPKAVNIPLDELRGRLGELSRDGRIVVSCMSGQRAYYACRILTQSGFQKVDNLSGAYKTYAIMKA